MLVVSDLGHLFIVSKACAFCYVAEFGAFLASLAGLDLNQFAILGAFLGVAFLALMRLGGCRSFC